MIKYIGSKRTLIPTILAIIERLDGVRSVVDLFSGTSRVGQALKRAGYRVHSNDILAFAYTLGVCYVQADREDVQEDAARLIAEFARCPADPGYFHQTFSVESRFFQAKNAARIDAIRNAIARKGLEPELEAVCLTSLMEAADRVDSTTGVQMAYLKGWSPRSYRDLELRIPEILPRAKHGKCHAHMLPASEAATTLHADLVYLDPPYNQHSYLGNYHIWETLVRGDEPEHYGKACKRIDCRERKSPFNRKSQAHDALRRVLGRIDARYVVVSFNDEGYVRNEEILAMLEPHGRIAVVENDYQRYVGAQIGIHNPAGKKVGSVGNLRNKERIYIVERRDTNRADARDTVVKEA